MPFFGFRATKEPTRNAHWIISETQAFDILCAQALQAERFPNDILRKGVATGWAERIRMLGEKYGWVVTISITDKADK